ncbi:MAG: sulfurtransferase [Verrucomicrobia bacterium]|nr:MAG: sulfurtransferase [Verrucomicrobiota bacterium]TAE86124.1 MAG: sulfurtransferase [Verrucomicrobiota bacterium]TAF23471.1 MAG: sulfurtransferase [Verrucomicrobiota bacterium]TAF40101.1 MAG: sulfurtransferase [Verrucomicrobiota bacterium]
MTPLPAIEDLEVSPATVADLLPAISRGEITLVDCREDDEWQFNRIAGARLVPLSGFASAPVPTGPTIIYCHHGMRSMRATNYWRSRGNSQVWSMTGGIHRWSTEVDPAIPLY